MSAVKDKEMDVETTQVEVSAAVSPGQSKSEGRQSLKTEKEETVGVKVRISSIRLHLQRPEEMLVWNHTSWIKAPYFKVVWYRGHAEIPKTKPSRPLSKKSSKFKEESLLPNCMPVRMTCGMAYF